jgi:hypothetical protein
MEPSVPQDMRMDFLNHSTELRHPRAQYLQSFVPKRFLWYSSVVLCWIFENKLYNLDTVRFISVNRRIFLFSRFYWHIIMTGSAAGHRPRDFPRGLRPHGTHHQYHGGTAQQLRPAETAELHYRAACVRVERSGRLQRNSRCVSSEPLFVLSVN